MSLEKVNSAVNQRIKSKLVEREVVYCCSYMIDELAQQEKYSDELQEILSQENWTDAALESDEWSELSEEDKADIVDNETHSNFCNDNNIDPLLNEALEHWIVSPWLANRLEELGEMILRNFLGFDAIWGRCCSGQGILLDGVISDIAGGMEILEGQKNEWKTD